MKISIIGDGGWGTALALNALLNRHQVTLWGAFPEYLQQIRARGENFKFLPGVAIPAELRLCGDMAEAVSDAEILILATPTQFLRPVLKRLALCRRPEVPVVNVAKGIEVDSWKLISEMVADELGSTDFVALSGPSHAEEVARKVPTAVVAAGDNLQTAKLVQRALMNNFFRIYTAGDVVGVELGGALKNVMAIAAGIIDGMKLGDNTKAAMMTRGVAEMSRLGEALGGQRSTFSGLSGIGDLIVTCTSGHSRNRHVGEELGRGKKMEAIAAEMGMVVAEGVSTAKGAYTLASLNGVCAPIIDEIYNVLYHERSVSGALHALMSRDAKPEDE